MNQLSQRVLNFAQPVGTLQKFARFGAVRCAYNAVSLHQVDEVSRAAVTDSQPSLQQGSRSLAVLQHDTHGVLEKLVIVIIRGAAASAARLVLFARSLQEILLILRRTLRAPEFT